MEEKLVDPKSGAVALNRLTRAGLFALGLSSLAAAAAIVVFKDENLPDLLLAALAICGLVSLALCVVGRLPSGFEVAGMEVNFTVDTLSDLLGTIRGLADIEPAAKDKIVELVRAAADAKVYAKANARYGIREPDPSQVTGSEHEDEEAGAAATDATIRGVLESIAEGPVLERQEVANSGPGKNPKFDYQFATRTAGGDIIAVCQVERYWNPSSLDLLKRKLMRAMLKSTIVSRAVVVVPRAGLASVRAAVGDIPGVGVMTQEQFERPDDAGDELRGQLGI
jgi:hypothetical protein